MNLTISEGMEEDWQVANGKNKVYLPIEDPGLFRDVQSIGDSCMNCAQIHSTVDYCHMRLVEARYPF